MQIREIFADYSDMVEPLSIDEAFLDVTQSSSCYGSGTLIADEIRQRVHREVGITISAGVAPNKFIAKVSSDWNKPNGIYVVPPSDVSDFVVKLPVEKIYGVGKVTAAKLHAIGVFHCGHLQGLTEAQLVAQFGTFGLRLYQLCRGVDERPVKVDRVRKSLSVERTYCQDIATKNDCLAQVAPLHQELLARMERKGVNRAIRKQFVKCRLHNFERHTMECVVSGSPKIAVFKHLMERLIERCGEVPVRLLGLGVRFELPSQEAVCEQLRLFNDNY